MYFVFMHLNTTCTDMYCILMYLELYENVSGKEVE